MSGVSPRKNLGSLFCQSQMLFTLECWVGEQVGAVKTPPVCTVKGRYRGIRALALQKTAGGQLVIS